MVASPNSAAGPDLRQDCAAGDRGKHGNDGVGHLSERDLPPTPATSTADGVGCVANRPIQALADRDDHHPYDQPKRLIGSDQRQKLEGGDRGAQQHGLLHAKAADDRQHETAHREAGGQQHRIHRDGGRDAEAEVQQVGSDEAAGQGHGERPHDVVDCEQAELLPLAAGSHRAILAVREEGFVL